MKLFKINVIGPHKTFEVYINPHAIESIEPAEAEAVITMKSGAVYVVPETAGACMDRIATHTAGDNFTLTGPR